ncbi:hypothetical protein [Baekduia alba]|uniref:hypothetical protein n=1 Tax=Baekduia alba TaxID=2997333 RepID=UPI00233F926F|nr:hypothetical protein [Baekduia alba]
MLALISLAEVAGVFMTTPVRHRTVKQACNCQLINVSHWRVRCLTDGCSYDECTIKSLTAFALKVTHNRLG